MAGQTTLNTLRFTGFVHGTYVQILIDSGSTHNFVQSRVAKFLALPIEAVVSMSVVIGNGSTLRSEGIVRQMPIKLSSHLLSIDAMVLPLFGADVILGVQWLSTLGPVIFDYQAMTLQFEHNGHRICLQGDNAPVATQLCYHSVRRLVDTNSVAALYRLEIQPALATEPSPAPIELQQLLNHYSAVFDEPTGLPPQRSQDHAIHLQTGAQPVNVKPYRYPHYQKLEIERLVGQMLETGIIRSSISPFSSPVLLVKKKDGTWRFCVDY